MPRQTERDSMTVVASGLNRVTDLSLKERPRSPYEIRAIVGGPSEAVTVSVLSELQLASRLLSA